jgi:N-acetylmuramoyl-L-alanine amidase
VQAVRSFQTAWHLRGDGTCDEATWRALVEASWKLGDRLLFLTAPNLRGDDVHDLQMRLARLGFDPGRIDGIFGPDTARALHDFQSNCGLVVDGVCGPTTVRTMLRVSGQTGSGPGVAALREQLHTGPTTIAGSRVVVGHFGGLGAVGHAVARLLRVRGAQVMALDEPDAVAQAVAANRFAADAYLGFEAAPGARAAVQYYCVPQFESVAGHALADACAATLAPRLSIPVEVAGLRLAVLRETRMPAVLCSLGDARGVSDAAACVADAVVEALELWMSRERS